MKIILTALVTLAATSCTGPSVPHDAARGIDGAATPSDGAPASQGRTGHGESGTDGAVGSGDGGLEPTECGTRPGARCAAGCGVVDCIGDWPICSSESSCALFDEAASLAWPSGIARQDEWGSGLALADVDGDGRVDALVGSPSGVHVVWGVGVEGALESDLLPSGGPAHVAGVTTADYDGDGDLDVFVTTQPPASGVHLIRNQGGRRFEDISDSALAGIVADTPGGPAWADFDGDEDLDVFVPCYIGAPSLLLRNDLDADRFVDVGASLGLADPDAASLQARWLDYDGDGDPDLLVANDKGAATSTPSRLFRNDGGSFVDVTVEVGLSRLAHGMGIAVGDIDGDLDLDIYMSDIGYIDGGQMLWLQEDGRFLDSADTWYAAATRWYGWGTEMADFDLDGDLDLLLGGTMPEELWIGENVGDRVVEIGDLVEELPAEGQVGLGTADFDRDGRLDFAVWIAGSRTRPTDSRLARFYVNRAPVRGHWLRVDLVNRAPNTDAVGATLMLHASGRTLMREIAAGGSFFSSSEPVAHFGLGEGATASRLEVRWPDGAITVVEGPIALDRTLTVER